MCCGHQGTLSVLKVTAAPTFLCDYTTAFQVTYLTNVLHKLDRTPPPLSSLLALPPFTKGSRRYTHAHTSPSSPLTPFSLCLSASELSAPPPPDLCRSKSNIWVSLYLVEQDLQDIVGRMCELEQFTLWESPIHTQTKRGRERHGRSQFADIVPPRAIQCDFQVR